MAIFNSYVKLPEGILYWKQDPTTFKSLIRSPSPSLIDTDTSPSAEQNHWETKIEHPQESRKWWLWVKIRSTVTVCWCMLYIYIQSTHKKYMLIYINRFLDKSLKWCIINQPPRMDYVTPKMHLFPPGVKQCHKPSPSHRLFYVVWLPFRHGWFMSLWHWFTMVYPH